MAAVCIFLWSASVQDLRDKTIPTGLPAVFLIAAILLDMLPPAAAGAAHLLTGRLSGGVPGALLLMVSFIARGAVGAGDGICLLVCGVWTGIGPALEMFMTASVLAGVYSCICLFIKKRDRHSTFAFLPFMAAAQTFCLCRDLVQMLQR